MWPYTLAYRYDIYIRLMWVRRALNVATCNGRRMFAIHQKLRSIRTAAAPPRTFKTNNAVTRTHICAIQNTSAHATQWEREREVKSAVRGSIRLLTSSAIRYKGARTRLFAISHRHYWVAIYILCCVGAVRIGLCAFAISKTRALVVFVAGTGERCDMHR